METLKTDYSDAVYEGKRTFTITQSNGAQQTGVNIEDTTVYTTGDYFGASDINSTNRQVNGLSNVARVTLASSSWSANTSTVNGGAYYTLTMSGFTIFEESPTITIGAAGTLPTETEEANFGMIAYAIANVSTGSITFYARSKPTGNIVVIVKGASR